MTAPALLAALRSRGHRLACVAKDEKTFRLVVTPAAGLTADDKAALALHKEALLDLAYRDGPDSDFVMGWPDDPRPPVWEWDDEAGELVERVRPAVLASWLADPDVVEPPEPVAGERVAPPAEAVLFYQDRRGRPCRPSEAVHLWTWAGAPRWYHAELHPPPRPIAKEAS